MVSPLDQDKTTWSACSSGKHRLTRECPTREDSWYFAIGIVPTGTKFGELLTTRTQKSRDS